jgi:hypothetical protein
MTFRQIVDYDDDTPISFRVFKKKILVDKIHWEDRVFYEIRRNQSGAKEWLQKQYGDQQYCDTWWATPNSIAMSEKIYTHYALSVE